MASAAMPELLAKLSMRPSPRMPAAAACRVASKTVTLRRLMWGQAWT